MENKIFMTIWYGFAIMGVIWCISLISGAAKEYYNEKVVTVAPAENVQVKRDCVALVDYVKRVEPNILAIENIMEDNKLTPVTISNPGKLTLSCTGTAFFKNRAAEEIVFFESEDDKNMYASFETRVNREEAIVEAEEKLAQEESENRMYIEVYGSVEKGKLQKAYMTIFAKQMMGQQPTPSELKEMEHWKTEYQNKFPNGETKAE